MADFEKRFAQNITNFTKDTEETLKKYKEQLVKLQAMPATTSRNGYIRKYKRTIKQYENRAKFTRFHAKRSPETYFEDTVKHEFGHGSLNILFSVSVCAIT